MGNHAVQAKYSDVTWALNISRDQQIYFKTQLQLLNFYVTFLIKYCRELNHCEN